MIDTGRKKMKFRQAALAELEKGIKCFYDNDVEQAQTHFRTVIKKYDMEVDIARSADTFLKKLEPVPEKQYKLETAEDYFHYSIFLSNHNRGDEAFEMLKKSLEMNPEDPEALYNLACYKARNKDKEGALEALKKAVRVQPMLMESATDDHDLLKVFRRDELESMRAPLFKDTDRGTESDGSGKRDADDSRDEKKRKISKPGLKSLKKASFEEQFPVSSRKRKEELEEEDEYEDDEEDDDDFDLDDEMTDEEDDEDDDFLDSEDEFDDNEELTE